MLANPQPLFGRGQCITCGGVPGAGGFEVLPGLQDLEPDTLLEAAQIGLERPRVVIGRQPLGGAGDPAEKVDLGDGHDGSRVAVGAERRVVIEAVPSDHSDLRQRARPRSLGFETARCELLPRRREVVSTVDGSFDPVGELAVDRRRRRQRRERPGARLIRAHFEVEGGLGEPGAVPGLLEEVVELGQVDLCPEQIGVEDEPLAGERLGELDMLGGGGTRLGQQTHVLPRLGEVDERGGGVEGDLLGGVEAGLVAGIGHGLGLVDARAEQAAGVHRHRQVERGDEGRQRSRLVGVRGEKLVEIESTLVQCQGEDLGRVVGDTEGLGEIQPTPAVTLGLPGSRCGGIGSRGGGGDRRVGGQRGGDRLIHGQIPGRDAARRGEGDEGDQRCRSHGGCSSFTI